MLPLKALMSWPLLHLQHQQPPHPKTSEDQADIQDTQLSWCLPSLHSESLKHEANASGNGYSACVLFHRTAKASTDNDSPALTHPVPRPLPDSDQQVWLQTLRQSQTRPDSHCKSEVQPQPLIQTWPPSPLSLLRICGVHLHRPQNAWKIRQSQVEESITSKALCT